MAEQARKNKGLGVSELLAGVETPDKESPTSSRSKVLASAEIPAVKAMQSASPTDGMERQYVRDVDPKDCRPWRYHDRMSESLTPERCAELIESILKEGQKEPAVVRALPEGGEFRYEIIYGARRHFACSYIRTTKDEKFPFKVVVKDILSDEDAAHLTYIENESPDPIRDFERGVFFRRLLGLESGVTAVFVDDGLGVAEEKRRTGRDKLMERFGVDKAKLSKLLTCAELADYKEVMDIIIDRPGIPFTKGYQLACLLAKDSHSKETILARARALREAGETLGVGKALAELIRAVEPRKERPEALKWQNEKGRDAVQATFDEDGTAQVRFGKPAATMSRDRLHEVMKDLVDAYLDAVKPE